MGIDVVPVLRDNFTYIVHAGNEVAVIDPGASAPVENWLTRHPSRLSMILLTHPHADHIGGVSVLQEITGASVMGPASAGHAVALDRTLSGGETFPLGKGTFTVWATPGHGAQDLSYQWDTEGAPSSVFCGDTLFVSGCGRILEGTAEALWQSLMQLAALPDATQVYCGHEYTEENLRFALSLAPNDPHYLERLRDVQTQLAKHGYSVPSTIGREKQANPFLRCCSLQEFITRRQQKDDFTG